MPAQLSKLHVRYIQTQKSFFLFRGQETKGKRLPLSQLYVKDNSHFYLLLQNDPIQTGQNVSILFNESTDVLKSLRCDAKVEEVQASSGDYEDALLFFHLDASTVKQLLLLSIDELREN